MGNCQAAEAATVVIQRPDGAVERIYWSVSSSEVMSSNPGHYVASVTPAVTADGTPVKQLKLLRPDDTLHIGHVYRLVSFEEVLKDLAGKKYSKLSKLLAMQRQIGNAVERKPARPGGGGGRGSRPSRPRVEEAPGKAEGAMGGRRTGEGVGSGRQRQWKPALQSIAEIGS